VLENRGNSSGVQKLPKRHFDLQVGPGVIGVLSQQKRIIEEKGKNGRKGSSKGDIKFLSWEGVANVI